MNNKPVVAGRRKSEPVNLKPLVAKVRTVRSGSSGSRSSNNSVMNGGTPILVDSPSHASYVESKSINNRYLTAQQVRAKMEKPPDIPTCRGGRVNVYNTTPEYIESFWARMKKDADDFKARHHYGNHDDSYTAPTVKARPVVKATVAARRTNSTSSKVANGATKVMVPSIQSLAPPHPLRANTPPGSRPIRTAKNGVIGVAPRTSTPMSNTSRTSSASRDNSIHKINEKIAPPAAPANAAASRNRIVLPPSATSAATNRVTNRATPTAQTHSKTPVRSIMSSVAAPKGTGSKQPHTSAMKTPVRTGTPNGVINCAVKRSVTATKSTASAAVIAVPSAHNRQSNLSEISTPTPLTRPMTASRQKLSTPTEPMSTPTKGKISPLREHISVINALPLDNPDALSS